MENSSAPINLVKKEETASFDRFMNWALGIGRLIVIIAEIIAIAAFIYRFSLDEKLGQIHSGIKQKQHQLSLLKKDEENYRNLQDRLSLASNFSDESTKIYKIFQDVVNFTPQEIKYNDLTLRKDKAVMDISATSIPSLTEFVNSLKNYANTQSVSIDNIESRPDIGLSIVITTLFK